MCKDGYVSLSWINGWISWPGSQALMASVKTFYAARIGANGIAR